MVEEESWYSWNQVKDQLWKVNQGDWKKPECGSNEKSRRSAKISRTTKLFI